MSQAVLLDSGLLGMVTNPKAFSREVQECKLWLNTLPQRNYAQAGLFPNTFWLLIYLLKDVTPPIDDDTSQWWELNKMNTPNNLGWYIDLAIKAWKYRIK